MIERLKNGETPTLLDTEKGNEIIDKINALENISIIRGGNDSFISSESNSILSLIDEKEENGKELDLYICYNGKPKLVTFYVKDLPS